MDLIEQSHVVEGLAGLVYYRNDPLTREEAATILAFARAVREKLESND
jgi:hypothetical protein